MQRGWIAWLAVVISGAASVLSGCSNDTPSGDEGASSTGPLPDASSTTRGSGPIASTTGGPPSDASTGVDASSSAGIDASSSTGGGTFIGDPDGGPPNPIECTTWDQDCARGEKCAPWANDGGPTWNALRCVPTVANPDQAGEPCTVEDSVTSGVDSCALGSMCWDVDPETLTGTCVPHCTGSPEAPECVPYQTCLITGGGALALCLPECLPTDAAPCPDGDGCYPAENDFGCSPDMSGDGGGLYEACASPDACTPGSTCVDPTTLDACDDASEGCCAPFCDLDAPTCPEGTQCAPFFETPPLGYEGLGVCAQESV